MKKHYFMLLGAALLGISANAETITLTEDGTLANAIANAAEGDVIELAVNQTITSRLGISGKTLTIQGATPDIAIVRGENYNNGIAVLINSKSNVTLQNLTCDGNNVTATRHFLEAAGTGSDGAYVTLNNVKFVNAITSSENNGIVKTIQNSHLTVNNCSFVNCTVPANNGNVFVGNTYAVVSGNTSTSFMLEKNITATDYTGNSDIYIKGITAGSNVVLGATEGFTLKGMGADYSLEAKDGNLVLAYNAVVVLNEATGEGYSSFMEAYNALAAVEGVDDIVLSVRENSQVSGRIGPKNFAFSVVGASDNITLTKTFTNTLFITNNAANNFENLIFDCNKRANNKAEIEVNQNDRIMALKNVKIINSASSVGIFTVKDGNRVLSLNNVTVEDYEGSVGVNLNGKLRLEGNNVIPAIVIANAGAEISVVGEGITNETPIEITFNGVTPAQDMVVVKGCTDASKFNFENTENWVLAAKDGNLVLANTTGIEGIVADDNAPVEYFNLQGVRVANPENGLYIRRQGSKVQKVLVK